MEGIYPGSRHALPSLELLRISSDGELSIILLPHTLQSPFCPPGFSENSFPAASQWEVAFVLRPTCLVCRLLQGLHCPSPEPTFEAQCSCFPALSILSLPVASLQYSAIPPMSLTIVGRGVLLFSSSFLLWCCIYNISAVGQLEKDLSQKYLRMKFCLME